MNSSNVSIARKLLRDIATAALGTLDEAGEPFVSHVIAALGGDGAPLMLLSGLARHTRNLRRDPRASLLLVGAPDSAGDAMTSPRLTLRGRVLAETEPASRAVFLARHPEAALYADLADFAVHRFHADAAHLVAGFGRIVDLAPADLGLS